VHFRNNYRSRRNCRNIWHLFHHVLPLEELATSNLKHKIGYTQSHTQLKQIQTCMYMNVSFPKSMGTCRTCGEGSLVWLFSSNSLGHGNSGNTPSLRVGQLLLCCFTFETWQLLKGGREREWMATFVWHTATKFWQQKCSQNTPSMTIVVILSSNGVGVSAPANNRVSKIT
jgi:hypothetical protein